MAPAQESSFVFRLVLSPAFWSCGELPREMHFSRDTGTIRVGRLDPEGVSPCKVWANAGFTGERGKLVSAQHAELQLVADGNVLLTSWSRNGTYIKAEVEWAAHDRTGGVVRVAAGEWHQLIGPSAASFKAGAMLAPERRYTLCFGRPKQASAHGLVDFPLQYSLSGDASLPAADPHATAASTAAARHEPPVSSREAPSARAGAKLPAGAAESYLARQSARAGGKLTVDTLLAGQTAARPAAAERNDTPRDGTPPSPGLQRATAAHAGGSQPADDHDSADDYDKELYKGEADRQAMLLLSEYEREMVLVERYDKHVRRREVLEMQRKLRERREH
jgi:hypothetical protein